MSESLTVGGVLAPFAPILASVAGAIASAAVAYGAAVWARWTHQQIGAEALAKITAAAQSEAAALVAAAADNLATRQIPVGSPIVADIVLKLSGALPGELAAAGLTPDRIATLVAGEIGKLQAQMTRAAPGAAAK